jgi:DNA (cytosine-5)-methyltransferase 1
MAHFTTKEYPMLIDETRRLLIATGKPYAIENVEGAPLEGVTLCGTMFGLKVFRHRIFESNVFMLQPPHITHRLFGKAAKQGKQATEERQYLVVTGNFSGQDYARRAMGIDWMTRGELSEAIPPAYTQWIGQRLMEYLTYEQ